ncbi:2401_t:CDS:2 [Paraglomus occultum]|uniref:2401_t:CDS:1 n=1 Tax=Paraglomus occultum TaxID=144539 RepID=A0A9N9F0L8_9GLOM|nr:2401_t:CDS:2 [Paraglomus occultum]
MKVAGIYEQHDELPSQMNLVTSILLQPRQNFSDNRSVVKGLEHGCPIRCINYYLFDYMLVIDERTNASRPARFATEYTSITHLNRNRAQYECTDNLKILTPMPC